MYEEEWGNKQVEMEMERKIIIAIIIIVIIINTYLIFVIFFTRAKFLEKKFTLKKYINYDKIRRKLPIFALLRQNTQ